SCGGPELARRMPSVPRSGAPSLQSPAYIAAGSHAATTRGGTPRVRNAEGAPYVTVIGKVCPRDEPMTIPDQRWHPIILGSFFPSQLASSGSVTTIQYRCPS